MKSRTWWALCKKTLLPGLYVLVAATLIPIGVGWTPTSMGYLSEIMPTPIQKIVGNWEKITDSACSRPYPDGIRFQENGSYLGTKDPPGTYTHWDVGTYDFVGPGRIEISLANDAIVGYSYAILNDVLRFVDPDGCEFDYRRRM